jgi:hypothetical protein
MEEVNRIILTADSGCSITLEPLDFVVFIDETGHELLEDPNYPIFGLGGCAILVQNYKNLIHEPWLDIKRKCFQYEHIQLHASESRNYTPGQISAIGQYFNKNLFCRVATLVSNKTFLAQGITNYRIVSSQRTVY